MKSLDAVEGGKNSGSAPQLAEQVFETLRARIMSGDLPPGFRLRIRDLASEAGTSVMPVRDAVARLVAEGLATHEPYRGASVRELDRQELIDAYEVRALIEGEAAYQGALVASPAVIAQMREHWHLLERAALEGDSIEALHQDELLLGALFSAAGNEVLTGIIEDLWGRCRPYRNIWATAGIGPGGLGIWRNKPSLIVAAQGNDGQAARDIIRMSYIDARETIGGLLAGNEE